MARTWKGFDPTYKGWKRQKEDCEWGNIPGFDPTYKGWKRVSVVFL